MHVIAMMLAASFAASVSVGAAKVDAKAYAVIERSQHTTATYSLFAWNDVPDGGEIKDGWSAEFHQGNLHRVETPNVRIIADCKALTGTRLLVSSGETLTDSSVAKAACGINANFEVSSGQWLGRHKTAFGVTDRVRIVAADAVRTYEVLENGALATSLYEDADGKQLVRNWAVAVLNTVPKDIFSEISLKKSAVPSEFQSAPTPLAN